MNEHALMDAEQVKLIIETIGKNGWWSADPDIHVDVWSNFHQSPDLLRNYLCKDGSGYIRGYHDGAGTLYVKKFHLRDEEWTDLQSSQPEEIIS
jgi:hypothetical protein